MKVKKIYFQSLGKKLFGIWEIPENTNKPAIILLHGLTNNHLNCPLINDTVKALHKLGYPTFRFDFFGSGNSEGVFMEKTWRILVQNTKDALKYVKTQLKYPKIGIWGRSLGAIFGATICDDSSIFASVLISFTIHTNISLSASFPKNLSNSLPIIGTAKVKGRPILHKIFYKETKWIDKLQKSHLLRAKNILIIQGTQDKTIYDLNWAREIYKTVRKPKKLIYIKGANHAYKGYERETINTTVKWFEKYC